MMDRKKKDELPKMQVGFIDFICMPVYQLFYDLEPCLKPLYDGCVNNKNNWLALADKNTQEAMVDSKEDNSDANNNNKDLAAEKNDKLITPERKVSQTKDSTSEGKVRNKDKKSKTCSIL